MMADDARREGVSSVEVYGFVGWISTFVAYVIYLLWAYVPTSVLARVGITYYPSTYWAIALPAWFCVSVLTLLIGYELYNATLGSIDLDKPCHVAPPFVPLPTHNLDAVHLFNHPDNHRLQPLRELPESVVEDVLNHGMDPLEAEKRWRALAETADADILD